MQNKINKYMLIFEEFLKHSIFKFERISENAIKIMMPSDFTEERPIMVVFDPTGDSENLVGIVTNSSFPYFGSDRRLLLETVNSLNQELQAIFYIHENNGEYIVTAKQEAIVQEDNCGPLLLSLVMSLAINAECMSELFLERYNRRKEKARREKDQKDRKKNEEENHD